MTNIQITNWRCIEKLEFNISKINIFIGQNSTGKSSLAYAIYFAAKSKNHPDPQYLLTQLYGYDFNYIARLFRNTPQFPISIKIGESVFSVKREELIKLPKRPKDHKKQESAEEEPEIQGDFKINKLSSSPWEDEYLLPSRRGDYFHILNLLPKMISQLKTEPQAEIGMKVFGSWMGGFFELFKEIPIIPPFGIFATDYMRALTGIKIESIIGKFKEAGAYSITINPYFSLLEAITQDPFTSLSLPPGLAPDGLIDLLIFDAMTRKIPENSLVVIEEPELYKNPLKILDFTKNMVERTLDKNLTLIMTTHSDIHLITIAKLVEEGKVEPEDVKIYYLDRDPWTTLSEIKIYQDGTIEDLPDTEELFTRLF